MNTQRYIYILMTVVACIIGAGAYNHFDTHQNNLSLSSSVRASPVRQSSPLLQVIADADVILVARVVKFEQDPNWKAPSSLLGIGTAPVAASDILKPPGEYSFHVIRVLKGQCNPNIKLKLPALLSVTYGTSKLQVEKGDQVLLFLKMGKRSFSPVYPSFSLLRLGDNGLPTLPQKDEDGGVESQVINQLIGSLTDSSIRITNTYWLRQVIDVRLPKALTPYLGDSSWRSQDNILYCLAINQQITAIPLIAKLETERFEAGSGTQAVTVLDRIKNPAAVPYLNQLLWKPAYFLRFNAMSALINLPNHSSIPYFVLALRDPDPQNYIPYSAYSMLYKLIPDLGTPKDWQLFQIQRETASHHLYAWWKDELRGKHLKPSNSKGQPQMSQKEISSLPLNKLNPLLFIHVTATRQKAMNKLEKSAENSSIPYLILALIDPDTSVSYDAYVTLHRLIPTLGTPKSSKEFEANTDAATQPIYTWWEDELNGNHLTQN